MITSGSREAIYIYVYIMVMIQGFVSSNSLLLIGQFDGDFLEKITVFFPTTQPTVMWLGATVMWLGVVLRNLFDLIIIVLSLLETALDLWVPLAVAGDFVFFLGETGTRSIPQSLDCSGSCKGFDSFKSSFLAPSQKDPTCCRRTGTNPGGVEQRKRATNGVSQQCALRANCQTGQGFTWHQSHATFEAGVERSVGSKPMNGVGWSTEQLVLTKNIHTNENLIRQNGENNNIQDVIYLVMCCENCEKVGMLWRSKNWWIMDFTPSKTWLPEKLAPLEWALRWLPLLSWNLFAIFF